MSKHRLLSRLETYAVNRSAAWGQCAGV